MVWPRRDSTDLGSRDAIAGSPDSEHALRARHRMVQEQLVARGIHDEAVLRAMRHVPRHLFVPAAERHAAYEDHPVPIGYGQTISQPYVVAFMTQAAQLPPEARVLDVGTGCGYQAAVLEEAGAEVYSLEIVPELAQAARERLGSLGYGAKVYCADGYAGFPGQAPFDAIVVAAAPPAIPPPLLEQLKIGGRLVVPVGADRDLQQLTVVTRTEHGFSHDRVMAVRFVPMTGRAEGGSDSAGP